MCLQCVLTYRVAVTALDYWMAHFRVALALGAMVSLVLSILYSLVAHPPWCAGAVVMYCFLYLLTSFKFIFTFDRDIHTKKITVVTNNINNDRLPFRSPSSKALILFVLTRWNDLLELSHH